MTIRKSAAGSVELIGACSSEDAEVLLQHLLTDSDTTVDWRACESAHAAVIQVLMATRPRLKGPPVNEGLRKWIQPALLPSATHRGRTS
jgi:hypothetical protein